MRGSLLVRWSTPLDFNGTGNAIFALHFSRRSSRNVAFHKTFCSSSRFDVKSLKKKKHPMFFLFFFRISANILSETIVLFFRFWMLIVLELILLNIIVQSSMSGFVKNSFLHVFFLQKIFLLLFIAFDIYYCTSGICRFVIVFFYST